MTHRDHGQGTPRDVLRARLAALRLYADVVGPKRPETMDEINAGLRRVEIALGIRHETDA